MSNNLNIDTMELNNFTLFSDLSIPFAQHINVISGETGVGKTNILKILYSMGKAINDANESVDPVSNEKFSELLSSKLIGVFRPDDRKIGRLVRRNVGRGKTFCKVKFRNDTLLSVDFSNQSIKNANVSGDRNEKSTSKFVYIPSHEIISSTENFPGLYEKYHISFEETYYDLSKLLLLPVRKGAPNAVQKKLAATLEQLVDGKVVLTGQKFYLKNSSGNIEMGLVAEGFRKISTLLQLIANGALTENTILFWDEPETNINPKMIPAVKNMLTTLAEIGVQVFITTHSYFLQQELSLFQQYENEKNLDIKFITLFKEEDKISFESQNNIETLEHNPIQQEFFDLYNKEQRMFYDN